MAQCRPDRCPNSCIASHHRPLWAKAIADGEELLKARRLSPLQREAIELDLKRYRSVLEQAVGPCLTFTSSSSVESEREEGDSVTGRWRERGLRGPSRRSPWPTIPPRRPTPTSTRE